VKRLILTADDFGASLPVNEAVEQACGRGVLTTASLMVAGAAFQDAVARARRMPQLRVGLHLVLVCGRPVLPAALLPDLAPGGALPTNLPWAGARFFFDPRVRRQLAAEIRAQFEAFKATGLALDHVNAHNHMHLHPTVCGLTLAIGREYGLAAMRVPYEPRPRALAAGPAERLFESAVLGPWIQVLARRLRRAGLGHNDYVFGLRDTGRMTAERVLQILGDLPEGTSEMYFHPATRTAAVNGLPPTYLCQEEFAALTDRRVAEAIRARGILLTSFSGLECGRGPQG
jgi:chitin disaccharide deacetylase